MSEARDTEIRALKDLVRSPGWALHCAQQREQAEGAPFMDRLKAAVRGRPNDGATECVKEVFAGRDALLGSLQWPERRIKELQAEADREAATVTDSVRRA